MLKIKLFEPTICLPAMNPRSLGATRRRLARLLWGQGELCRGVSELCWGVLKNPVGVFTIKIQTQLSMVMYLFCFFLCIYIYISFFVYIIYLPNGGFFIPTLVYWILFFDCTNFRRVRPLTRLHRMADFPTGMHCSQGKFSSGLNWSLL